MMPTSFLDTATSGVLFCLRGKFALTASDSLLRFLLMLATSLDLLLLPYVSCSQGHLLFTTELWMCICMLVTVKLQCVMSIGNERKHL